MAPLATRVAPSGDHWRPQHWKTSPLKDLLKYSGRRNQLRAPSLYLLAPSLAQNASNCSLVHRICALQPRLHSSCVGLTTIVPPGLV
jgi:hypothetical protein